MNRTRTLTARPIVARALAVRGQRVLLFGDYERRDRTRVVGLGPDGRARVTEEVGVIDAEGRGFEASLAYGVGSTLFLVRDRVVFALDSW